MKTELLYLALVTTFTGLMWVPYVLDRKWRRSRLWRWSEHKSLFRIAI